MLPGEFLGTHGRDRSLLWITLTDVQFVSDKHQYDLGLCMVLDLVDPFFDVFERLLFGDVVHQQSAKTLAVMCRRDRLESLLTG